MYRPTKPSPDGGMKDTVKSVQSEGAAGKGLNSNAQNAPESASGGGGKAEGSFASLSHVQLPASPANEPEGQEGGQETAQEAPTPMGFRKRSLGKSKGSRPPASISEPLRSLFRSKQGQTTHYSHTDLFVSSLRIV